MVFTLWQISNNFLFQITWTKNCSLLPSSVVELEKDANQLRVGLSNLKKEIEILQTQDGGSEEDRFVRVMSDFVTVASLSFAEVDEILEEAKTKVRQSPQ